MPISPAPTSTWPLPSGLRFQSDAGGRDWAEAQVQLFDGQLLRGTLPLGANLTEGSSLKLRFMGQAISVPVSDIRSVTHCDSLVAAAPLTRAQPAAPQVEHEQALVFHVLFVDGEVLDGETWGFSDRKAGGMYLYVRQPNSRFKALWLPRNSYQMVSVRPATASPALRGGPAQTPLQGEVAAVSVHEARTTLATNMDELLTMIGEARVQPMISMAQAMVGLKLMDEEKYRELESEDSDSRRAHIDTLLTNSQISEFELEHARAQTVKMPEVDAELFKVEPRALAKLHWGVAAKQSVVPLGMHSGTLYVASCEPMNRALQTRLCMLADCNVALVWASNMQIDNRLAQEAQKLPSSPSSPDGATALRRAAKPGAEQDLQTLLQSARDGIKVEGADVQGDPIDDRSSVVMLVKRIITDAHLQRASDIHIETNPRDGVSRVRFRKDGALEEYLKLPSDLRAPVISRIKVMSRLDITERRRPQDGKINFADFSDLELELRVAVLPTHDNQEDIVMRLLGSSKPTPLAQLGFSKRDQDIVGRLAQKPYGLILACGPTGSGKTTTLHSLLHEINSEDRKIWTAEDPIEITQPRLRQLQVNPKIGVTFASAMRAFLRADPDVIMIGEIRDEETARIAIEASLTGHLVLSTLHTNNAAESVVRLLDLGMDPMNFGDSLLGIVAQRLVRALCPQCKLKEALEGGELARLAQEYVAGTELSVEEGRRRLLEIAQPAPSTEMVLYRPVGCANCAGKGYKGRMGVYEILENSAEVRQLIQKRAATSLIFAQAISAGTRSLKQDALEKAFGGAIDLKQAASAYS